MAKQRSAFDWRKAWSDIAGAGLLPVPGSKPSTPQVFQQASWRPSPIPINLSEGVYNRPFTQEEFRKEQDQSEPVPGAMLRAFTKPWDIPSNVVRQPQGMTMQRPSGDVMSTGDWDPRRSYSSGLPNDKPGRMSLLRRQQMSLLPLAMSSPAGMQNEVSKISIPSLDPGTGVQPTPMPPSLGRPQFSPLPNVDPQQARWLAWAEATDAAKRDMEQVPQRSRAEDMQRAYGTTSAPTSGSLRMPNRSIQPSVRRATNEYFDANRGRGAFGGGSVRDEDINLQSRTETPEEQQDRVRREVRSETQAAVNDIVRRSPQRQEREAAFARAPAGRLVDGEWFTPNARPSYGTGATTFQDQPVGVGRASNAVTTGGGFGSSIMRGRPLPPVTRDRSPFRMKEVPPALRGMQLRNPPPQQVPSEPGLEPERTDQNMERAGISTKAQNDKRLALIQAIESRRTAPQKEAAARSAEAAQRMRGGAPVVTDPDQRKAMLDREMQQKQDRANQVKSGASDVDLARREWLVGGPRAKEAFEYLKEAGRQELDRKQLDATKESNQLERDARSQELNDKRQEGIHGIAFTAANESYQARLAANPAMSEREKQLAWEEELAKARSRTEVAFGGQGNKPASESPQSQADKETMIQARLRRNQQDLNAKIAAANQADETASGSGILQAWRALRGRKIPSIRRTYPNLRGG